MIPSIAPPDGKLLILIPGLGAVASTFIAGIEAIRKGIAAPLGSLSQMQTIRLGPRSDRRNPLIKDFLPLASLSDLDVAAWDVFSEDALAVARRAGVLESTLLDQVGDFLGQIRPMKAAFDQRFVKRLNGDHVKASTSRADLVSELRDDIRAAMEASGASRAVMIWCGSTEIYLPPSACHQDPDAFQRGLEANDESIAPSQLYAWAAIQEGVPFANGAPNLTVDTQALSMLAQDRGVALAGKDFKTGQTLFKTVLAPAFKARMLGVEGWFSTNILGNRDGEVLDDPGSFRSKEVTKTAVLDAILQPDLYPDLYSDLFHKVAINYYPPRGDAKEGWDNVDFRGWLGYPMQLKVNLLCRDSILAAPIVLDLALFLDLAQRAGLSGVQEWLSFYFKSPQVEPGHVPEHDLFIQHIRLKNALRAIGGEDLVTHLPEQMEPGV